MGDGNEPLRLRLTFVIAALGIGAVVLSFVVALFVFADAKEPGQVIVAVLGPVVGVVGTLAGYVAGQAAGAAGKERVEENRDRAERRATEAQQQLAAVAGASTEPNLIGRAKEQFPEFFPARSGSEAES
jgi:cell shape-determining protein MreC